MNTALEGEVREILRQGQDLVLATLRPDGWPQATAVSYASDGLDIYFVCAAQSQKARNLAADPRVSASVTLPYEDWNDIRGLSLAGRVERLADPAQFARVASLFTAKFGPQVEALASGDSAAQLAVFRLTPAVASVLDYRKGFGACELVSLAPAPLPA